MKHSEYQTGSLTIFLIFIDPRLAFSIKFLRHFSRNKEFDILKMHATAHFSFIVNVENMFYNVRDSV